MNKNNITGWRDVFTFTLVQTLKSKAFRVSFLLLILIALVSMPIIQKVMPSSEVVEDVGKIEKVYIINETSLPVMDFSFLSGSEDMNGVNFLYSEESYDSLLDKIETKENTSVVLSMSEDNGMYELKFVKASKGSVKNSNLSFLSNKVLESFQNHKIASLGITSEQLKLLSSGIAMNVSVSDIYGEEIIREDTSISQSEYWFIYGLLFIVMLVNVMASSQIATSIVTDKSTKIVEYLLTSVKPLAIMVGKVLAMLVAVLLNVFAIIISIFVSNIISILINGTSESPLKNIISADVLSNLNIINIFFCLILISLGMIFYAILAGLAGATVSRIEEASESLTLFTFINLIGVYIGMGAAGTLMGTGENAFVYFAFLFPLSSPFLLPGAILIGKVNYLIIGIAILLLLLFIAVLFKFVAKVYETLILHNGNKIGLKELFKLSKTM